MLERRLLMLRGMLTLVVICWSTPRLLDLVKLSVEVH